MNNHDLLDTIGDLSEETVHKYALPDSRNTERAKDEKHMDTTVTQPITQTKKKPFRISMGAAAAAIAVCVGLNAAIIFGVHKMKQDAAGITSGSQMISDSEMTSASQGAPIFEEPDHPYMTVMEASSTEISVRLRNPTDKDFSINPEFAILDGDRIIPVNYLGPPPESHYVPKQTNGEGFSYEFLDDGTYKFVNLNKDGSVSDSFEPVEFRIPTVRHEYDEHDQPYMEVMGANETEVTVKLKNPTNKAFTYHSEFAVMDGKKKIMVNRASVYELDTPLAPQQTVYVVFAYQRQKPGKYKFVNLNKDSTVSDSFEPVEFEIPAEQKDSIRVPELIGMDCNEAAEMYGDRIQIVADSFEYSGYEENRIFDQDIPAEGLVSTGTTVHVKVSLGNKKVLMPDVTDWEFETAKSTIIGLGLYADKRSAYSSEVEKGRVISTDPEGPVEIEPGSYVRVTVSLGKNPDTVPVPNFVNMDWDTAKNIADSLNLELVKKQIVDEAEKGTVLKQSVQPTEEVGEGSVIELTVSSGQKQEAVRMSFNIPAGAAGKYHIGLYEGGVAKAVGGQFDTQYANGVTSLMIEGIDTAEMVAVLYNDENGKEASIGTYRLDFDKKSYEALSEDIAGAFKAVQ
ncbi:MAG: PASTA domain-containing protein [Oscillospiraceae bacterium]|nr:PASTA domain-containing protein [Oscillospiraceae bacterium]